MTLLEYLNMGGVISWGLLFALFLTVVLGIERFLYFILTGKRTGKRNGNDSGEDSRSRGQYSRMKRAAAASRTLSDEKGRDYLEREGALIIKEMKKGLWILGFISSAAPSVGLFGTVLGLIQSFQQMDVMGAGASVEHMAGGIWVAMLTTAFGLAAAIPALFLSRAFNALIERRIHDMNMAVLEDEDSEQDNESVPGMKHYA